MIEYEGTEILKGPRRKIKIKIKIFVNNHENNDL